MKSCLLLVTLACSILATWSCKLDQYQNGCKISQNSCTCTFGCRSEYIYKTRRACSNALKEMQEAATSSSLLALLQPERASNICSNTPCSRGTCIQTTNEPGFTCKCDGTGYYGQRCQKACPTSIFGGLGFPHECIII